MTCSYSKEYNQSAFTDVENVFIYEYMPNAEGEAVKVYLYGLFMCKNTQYDQSLSDIAKTLNMTEEQVISYFSFWEDFGILSILNKEPLQVEYLPVRTSLLAKPRKFKAEKYGDFTKGVQLLLSARMISTHEYSEYYSIIETYGIQPEAMLMIVKYCTDLKGNNINYKYIIKVARDFGNRGLVTVEKIEKELSTYLLHTSALKKILSALSLRRQPEIEDLNYFNKWTKELNFEADNIIFAAKTLKKGTIEKLDKFILELYSQKSFTKEDIASYSAKQQEVFELAIKINNALSIYEEVIATVVDTYTNKWLSYGFVEQTLLLIASYCFRNGTNTLQQMDILVENLRQKGYVDLTSVSDYFENEKKTDKFITKLLTITGVNRRPTQWDRDNLAVWKSWNFSEDMILEAGKLACGKSSPLAYINGILSNWKNNDIFTLNSVSATTSSPAILSNSLSQEAYNVEYSRRRNVAVTRSQQNIEKARKITGFSSLYERMFSIEKDLAFAEISGDNEVLKGFEKEKIDLQNKISAMLDSIGLKLDDLAPQYQCKKCNDTGYVGDKRCDCYINK